MKVVLITGGFDPLHSGHISYINAARALGDKLIVGINSDDWLRRKKGRSFMTWQERADVVGNLKAVDKVISFDDSDDSAVAAINSVMFDYNGAEVIFANGGDRTGKNILEMRRCMAPNLKYVFGVGGEDKKNSSSWILEEWKAPKTERPWGYYRVLHEVPGMKVKELTVNPGSRLSMQRHGARSEYWIVSSGNGVVLLPDGEGGFTENNLSQHEQIKIDTNTWHQLYNPYDIPCKIVEIQYGERCEEEDIERR
jgi:cytidyltransferase-like protein